MSCYSYSVRNWLTTVSLPLEMVYLEITKEWMRLKLRPPALAFYHPSLLSQVRSPEDPGKGHWFCTPHTLPYTSHVLQLHQPSCCSLWLRALSPAGPPAWNTHLPENLMAHSLTFFKSLFKCHFLVSHPFLYNYNPQHFLAHFSV